MEWLLGLIDYSFYPFLNGARRPIENLEEQAIIYAKNNIENYKPTRILELDLQIFLCSTIMIRNIGNKLLRRKFVSNMGKSFESRCLKDIHDKDIRMELLEYFGVTKDVEYIIIDKKTRLIKIHIVDYLEIQQHDPERTQGLQLVNQSLDRGYVIIEISRFVYLLRIVFEHRLLNKLKTMQEYIDNELINRCVKELRERYPENKKRVSVAQGGSVPESIQSLIEKIHIEHYLDHRSRIKLGIYLQANNYEWDYIMDLFSKLSDFDPKVTEYQLRSLQRYLK